MLSSSVHRITERHIDKKMKRGSLELKTINIGGDHIEYWDNSDNAKDKPAIVLIHGFGTSTKYQWFRQIKILKDDYRILMPNLFHFGNSKPGTEKFELKDQVELVHDLIMELKIEKYTICGISYGGLVGIELANNYKNEIDQLIIFDAPIKFVHADDIINVCKFFEVESVEKLFVPDDESGVKIHMYLVFGIKFRLPDVVFRKLYNEAYAGNREDKRMLMTTLLNNIDDYANHEYSIDVPTLLIWGEDDKVIPFDRAEKLNNYLGETAVLHKIKNAAHMPNLSKPSKVNKLLKDFLKK
jgi:pimeloyl-ACP methyl ester carboxylesterase